MYMCFISRLLRTSISPNIVNAEGSSLLHAAVAYNQLHIISYLLHRGAHMTCKDAKGCTPLHVSCLNGFVKATEILLSHPDSQKVINVRNQAQETALHISSQRGYAAIVDLLLRHGADAKLVNRLGENCLDVAAKFGWPKVAQCIIQERPDLVIDVQTLEYNKCKNSSTTAPFVSALHLAAETGDTSVVRILLDAGFDINKLASFTERGSALHVAALAGKLDVVKLLLDRGINKDSKDYNGLTTVDLLKEHRDGKRPTITKMIAVEDAWDDCIKLIEGYRSEIPGPAEVPNVYINAFHQKIWDYLPAVPLSDVHANSDGETQLHDSTHNGRCASTSESGNFSETVFERRCPSRMSTGAIRKVPPRTASGYDNVLPSSWSHRCNEYVTPIDRFQPGLSNRGCHTDNQNTESFQNPADGVSTFRSAVGSSTNRCSSDWSLVKAQRLSDASTALRSGVIRDDADTFAGSRGHTTRQPLSGFDVAVNNDATLQDEETAIGLKQLLNAYGDIDNSSLNVCDKGRTVEQWLSSLDLKALTDNFLSNGYDEFEYLAQTMDSDALDLLGICSGPDRRAAMDSLKSLYPQKRIPRLHEFSYVSDWLLALKCHEYLGDFLRHGMDTVQKIHHLCEHSLEVIPIRKKGHKQRILKSLGVDNRRIISLFDENGGRSTTTATYRAGSQIRFAGAMSIELPQPPYDPYPEIFDEFAVQYLGSVEVSNGICVECVKHVANWVELEMRKKLTPVELWIIISSKDVRLSPDHMSSHATHAFPIMNILCVCQSGIELDSFALSIFDQSQALSLCHCFRVCDQKIAAKIILTLGEAFENLYVELKKESESKGETFIGERTNVGEDLLLKDRR
ncbi:unnamed protein product [Soboliphyme baturini]|uniref:ANK_REP_REGION domain-containing protein n=1 Tax=Soboliphyme baturini TaxID=241478 RepID=A0A183INU4_9BILA|nr:unnamed protein product [Soboliphyme baturini]